MSRPIAPAGTRSTRPAVLIRQGHCPTSSGLPLNSTSQSTQRMVTIDPSHAGLSSSTVPAIGLQVLGSKLNCSEIEAVPGQTQFNLSAAWWGLSLLPLRVEVVGTRGSSYVTAPQH